MEIRAAKAADWGQIQEIDGTVSSTGYLHVERAGEGLAVSWRLEERPLRQRLVEPNPLGDETRYALKQILSGAEEGLALVAEHEDGLAALLVAAVDEPAGVLRVLDVRADSDYRRQGLGIALLYRAIQEARDRELRAVCTRTLTNNLPAARLLQRALFDLAGLDLNCRSNHDLVKEAVTLFWYASLG